MHITPREQDKLYVFLAAQLARQRQARGLALNYAEAMAILAFEIAEGAREGRSVAELMALGKQILGPDDVMPGVADLLAEVQVEATFADGTKLVTVHQPIPSGGEGAPGEYLLAAEPIAANVGRPTASVTVANAGDRPIQIGSHFHFFEVNTALRFEREAAFGMRLNVPAGTAVRFEPGEEKRVELVALGGDRLVYGLNGLTEGAAQTSATVADPQRPALTIPRPQYADLYGPTTGDRVRLADTDLVLEVERDRTHPGDEVTFGGGKVIRDGMGQSTRAVDALDLVITNALILDHWGIVKADIGVKDGRIAGIGKAGNPDVLDGVDPNLVIGASTEVIAGEGKLVTAGGIDAHVHFICPQQVDEAIASGITTMLGGGTGPATGTNATTCTPGPWNLARMLQAVDALPVNVGLLGKGNCATLDPLRVQIEAGACGLKLHEDWGTTPAAIDACLRVADEHDVQAAIHTDTINEAGFVETTIAAIAGRTIHTYHTEGAGGGHAPDILRIAAEPHVLPSSTNPTRPYTVNTIDEHLDMLMVCHHLNPRVPEDVAFADSRIRAQTIMAEDILHDLGALSIMSSDSQAMGRVGEVIIRTWQAADKMKRQRGPLPGDSDRHDNARIKRYLAKYTINPAIAQGLAGEIGSIETGKLADLVVWLPKFFGVKPELVLKGGMISWAAMGDANASIPTPQPVRARPMFGALAPHATAVTFVSAAALAAGVPERLGLGKRAVAVENTRAIGKRDLIHNDATPRIEVDPETYAVRADGELLVCEPARELPLAQRYFLF